MKRDNLFKPMLATNADIANIRYPVYGTPKFDGVRCCIVNGVPLTRTLKDIPNNFVRNELTDIFNGIEYIIDGELISGSNFQETTSAIMSEDGEPVFSYNIFDYVKSSVAKPYLERIKDLELLEINNDRYCIKIVPVKLNCHEEMLTYENKCLVTGYEGIIIRSGFSPYKFGRSSVKECYMLKIKRFTDSEAIILGYEELMHNNNDMEINELGYIDRSTSKEGLIPMNTLGSIKVKDIISGIEFSIGSGFTEEQRKEIWNNKEKYINSIVKYKHQSHGAKELPRFPVFIGIRSPLDM